MNHDYEAYRLLRVASDCLEETRPLDLEERVTDAIRDAYVAVELALDALGGSVIAGIVDRARLEMWLRGLPIDGGE